MTPENYLPKTGFIRGVSPSRLKSCEQMEKFRFKNIKCVRPGLRIQPRYEAPDDLRVKN